MRAVGIPRDGGPEVLEIVDLPVPEPGAGEVRIRVAAATVNPTDIALRELGDRLGRGLPRPYVPGMEVAGIVDAVGEGAPWEPGQRVMAIVMPIQPGAQAEYVV